MDKETLIEILRLSYPAYLTAILPLLAGNLILLFAVLYFVAPTIVFVAAVYAAVVLVMTLAVDAIGNHYYKKDK